MRSDMAPYLTEIDASKRILEIGPLTAPMFEKSEAQVFYADIRGTEDVRALYAHDPSVDKEKICNIDFVIKGSYQESLCHVEKFDYVVSSHVLEHMPRLIQFFQDIETVITANGFLYLFVPDHRYCFDHFRMPTSFAEAYFIHTQGIEVPPWRVLDSVLDSVPLNCAHRFWSGTGIAAETLHQRVPFTDAAKAMERVLAGEYVDAHFSVFSPRSFIILVYNLISARLFPFSCTAFYPTEQNTFTFGAVFQRCPDMRHEERIIRRELNKLAMLLDAKDVLGA